MTRKRKIQLRPRDAAGKFLPVVKIRPLEERVANMEALREWCKLRHDYVQQLAHVKREERWGGVRTLAIFTAISTVLVGLLVMGVMSA